MASALVLNLLAAASGVFAHLAVFRRGEWDVASPSIFVFYFSVSAAAALLSHEGLVSAPGLAVAQIGACHIGALYTSMLLYRGFFHRLSKYPGPFFARLTNFYITALSMKKLHLFEEVQKLHAQYGDYVRLGEWHSQPRPKTINSRNLGPRELSIADPEAVLAIYGSQSPVTKGPWYTLLEPRVPLFMARDKQEHARRRKVWDQGFTTKGK
jgi:hypothetical protein